MKITLSSFLAALGVLLCMLGIHCYSRWIRANNGVYRYRTCERCSDIQTTN